jgi:hypothetical protein
VPEARLKPNDLTQPDAGHHSFKVPTGRTPSKTFGPSHRTELTFSPHHRRIHSALLGGALDRHHRRYPRRRHLVGLVSGSTHRGDTTVIHTASIPREGGIGRETTGNVERKEPSQDSAFRVFPPVSGWGLFGLITRRSQVQILPPLRNQRPGNYSFPGLCLLRLGARSWSRPSQPLAGAVGSTQLPMVSFLWRRCWHRSSRQSPR